MKINDEIFREVAVILRSELSDPRVNSLISVTKVDTTNDLKHCKISVSIFADDKNDAMIGLKNSASYIRRLLANRINLRHTPQITFVLDETLDYSMHISALIDQINAESGARKSEPNND